MLNEKVLSIFILSQEKPLVLKKMKKEFYLESEAHFLINWGEVHITNTILCQLYYNKSGGKTKNK